MTPTRAARPDPRTGTLFHHTHLGPDVMQARMVDVGDKPHIARRAHAEGRLVLARDTLERIRSGLIDKGDALTIGAVAAVQAAKRTPDWLPLCHPLPLTHVAPHFTLHEDHLHLEVTVATTAPTGVEMEALTAVSAGLLTVWDLVKSYEKDLQGQYPDTRIDGVRVMSKEKGRPSARAPESGE